MLFSTVVFSQNYNYGIDEPQKQTLPVVPLVNNQLEEIEYFKAYLLPITKKATIQSALDTYGSVRLEKGDYRGVNVVMNSNQRLYGHPALTQLSSITIAAGSSGVRIENILQTPITFQAGAITSNCVINRTSFNIISARNAMLENNSFINVGSSLQFDCSTSGYLRNNKILKHQVQGVSNQLIMKGNSTTPSYGNIVTHSNYLGSLGVTTDISNLQSATFIAVDAETYTGLTAPVFNATNIGRLNLGNTSGKIFYDTPNGFYNIDATNAMVIGAQGGGVRNGISTISPRTNVLDINSEEMPVRSAGTVTGFNLRNNFNTNVLTLNGVEQTATITDPTTVATISSSILGTQYTPLAKPTFATLPDPLGANWDTDRIGKPDSTAYIQNLIDTNELASLPEGVYYISSSLHIISDSKHGIIGSGTGKTVICGLTDDFPLITIDPWIDLGSFVLSNLTLQGGSIGLLMDGKTNFVAYLKLNYLVFRNQNYAINLSQISGLDNNFFDNVSFVNCTKGFFAESIRPYVGGVLEGSSYIDKTVFYQCQFLNCTTAFDWDSTRTNNLNAWVDCKFDGGSTAFTGGGNDSVFINCTFTNYTGLNLIKTNKATMYSCDVYSNTNTGATFDTTATYLEGCNILDNRNLLTYNVNQNIFCSIANSTVTGNALVSGTYHQLEAVYTNSALLSNPTLSKLLVHLKAGVPKVLINATPKPYPQFLVTQ